MTSMLGRGLSSPRPSAASGRGGAFSSPARGRGLREASDEGLRRFALTVLASVCVAACPASAAGLAGDADRGEQIYQACTDCHSLDKNDVGPRHRGVFGRKAASLPDYDYSDAL